jgi:hypothetical protein
MYFLVLFGYGRTKLVLELKLVATCLQVGFGKRGHGCIKSMDLKPVRLIQHTPQYLASGFWLATHKLSLVPLCTKLTLGFWSH